MYHTQQVECLVPSYWYIHRIQFSDSTCKDITYFSGWIAIKTKIFFRKGNKAMKDLVRTAE